MGKHAEWRKLAKKLRRKRIRTMLAVARDQQLLQEQEKRERSPSYRAWLEEQKELEEFKATEEARLAMQRQAKWEADEEAAMMRWRDQQSRLAQAKAEKVKREIMIREEWEREQRKLEEAEEVRKKVEDEKKRKQAELLAQIDAFIEGKGDFPDEANISSQTHPGHPDCPFFSKTGACRFRDSCSRNHTKPGISRVLLLPNFYDHIGLSSLGQEEYDTDLSLEFEESETYQHFKEFFNDVLPEFEQCGRVVQFRVCTNEESHLRGNVYVEFGSRRHALKAYRTFQGRFYAGRRLNVEFTTIPSWKNAVCGLYHKQKCPKGKTCNFLHVFRNPNNAFKINSSSSSRRHSRSRSRSPQNKSKKKEWVWSEDSDQSDSESSRKKKRSHSKNRHKSYSRKYESGSEDDRRNTSSRNGESNKESRRRDRKWSRSKSPSNSSKKYKVNDRDELSRKSRSDDTRKREKGTSNKEESSKSRRVTEERSKTSKYDDNFVKDKERDKSIENRRTEKGKSKHNKDSR